MDKKTALIIIVLLIISNVFTGVQYFKFKDAPVGIDQTAEVKNNNNGVLEFTKLFIDEVLNSDEEVDFDTRLKLENSVRDLNDLEILNQWNRFLGSETEEDAQIEVKNLLTLLINKI